MADELHGDPRTLAAVLFTHQEQVLNSLRAADRTISVDEANDAFVQAVMQIGEKPENYDPDEGDIVGFLVGASRRTLRDIVRKRTALRRGGNKKTLSLAVVGFEQSAREKTGLEKLIISEQAAWARAEIARTEEETRFLDLWLNDVQDTLELARSLGAEHLPEAERERKVTRCRKRLMKRMERLRERLEVEESQ